VSDYKTTLKVDADTSGLQAARDELAKLHEERARFEQGRDPTTGAPGGAGGPGGGAGGGGGGGAEGGARAAREVEEVERRRVVTRDGRVTTYDYDEDGNLTRTRTRRTVGQWGKDTAGQAVNQAPGYGMIATALAGIPVIGGLLASGVSGLMETRSRYAAYESSEADLLALEGNTRTSRPEGLGVRLGLGPAALRGQLRGLLGGGYNQDALTSAGMGAGADAIARRLAVTAALTAGDAYGIDSGTFGEYLGQWKEGGGLSRRSMGSTDPYSHMMLSMSGARLAENSPQDIGRYLSMIAANTANMAEQGLNIDPLALVTLGETLRQVGGGSAAGIDLSRQATGLRGMKAGQAWGNMLMGVGRGQGSPMQEAMIHDLMGTGDGESYFENSFRLQNVMHNPQEAAGLLLSTIKRFRESPGDKYERWWTMSQFFPDQNPNDLMAWLTGDELPELGEVSAALGGNVGDTAADIGKRAGRSRQFKKSEAGMEREDVQRLRGDASARGFVLKADRAFFDAKRVILDTTILTPGSLLIKTIDHLKDKATAAPGDKGVMRQLQEWLLPGGAAAKGAKAVPVKKTQVEIVPTEGLQHMFRFIERIESGEGEGAFSNYG
jgi:hypothetical protein